MSLTFDIIQESTDTAARLGKVHTCHGDFDTPAFMPVGTRGTVKGITPDQLRATGAQIILGNTYHLLLRPGSAEVETLGGLQRFTAWHGPMLTDSGGFQVFSLSELRNFDDDGVTFRSHIDGAMVRMTPESSISTQYQLGSDIAMAFDDCPPADCPPERLAQALDRTLRWAKRSKDQHDLLDVQRRQSLFGIVQGGTNPIERKRCAEALLAIGFDGYALGGLAVGEGHERMVKTIQCTAPLLPKAQPRYLMGVGYPRDILAAVNLGIDMFDCVLPSRNGRNGLAFTYTGAIRLRNAKHLGNQRPIEDGCDCYACQNFSRGYIRHLFAVDEMLGPILVSIHNLRFYQRWMLDIRRAIRDNSLSCLVPPPDRLEDAAQ